MTSWHAEYSAALDARDAREKAQIKYINAYTKLADRTAAIETSQQVSAVPAPASPSLGSGPVTAGKGKGKEAESLSPNDAVAKLRAELASTQKVRSDLTARLKRVTTELDTFRLQSTADTKKIDELSREKVALERKLQDREHEIRAKGSLLREGQDEVISLTLQLNMFEKRTDELKRENKELVDRWMARMGQEAEAMNNASKWS